MPNDLINFDDVRARRAFLSVLRTNVAEGVSIFNAVFSVGDGDIDIRLRLVANRQTLDPAVLAAYLRLYRNQAQTPLETLAQTILDDINDQLIPYWIEVRLGRKLTAAGAQVAHEVKTWDRQPKWDGTEILARLDP